MTTMPIREYADKHGLSGDGLADMWSSLHENEVKADDSLPIKDLDDLRESIYEMAIEDLAESRDALDAARSDLRDAEAVLQASVKEALLEGVPAKRVAQVLGVSRARVYQIRDGKR